MADVHDKATRSFNMSQIKGKNTKPEMAVRRFLYSHGIRYRIHDKTIQGKPDIVIKKYKVIVDIRGCFWHGHSNCKYGNEIKSSSKQITERVTSAIERDKKNEAKWKEMGWNVIIIWDMCELEIKKKNSGKRDQILSNLLNEIIKER